jgi:hypothetical protein
VSLSPPTGSNDIESRFIRRWHKSHRYCYVAGAVQVFRDNGHKLVEKKMNKDELLAAIGQYDGLVVRSGVRVTEEV